MPNNQTAAIGPRINTHLRMLSECLPKVFSIPQDDHFDSLLKALDRAERHGRRKKPN